MLLVLALMPTGAAAESHAYGYESGSVIRMETTSCTSQSSGVMARLSGIPAQTQTYDCWVYTLLTDKIVYRATIRKNRVLLPLAEQLQVRLKNGEMLVRPDGSDQEFKLEVVSATLRSEWEKAGAASDGAVRASCTPDAAGGDRVAGSGAIADQEEDRRAMIAAVQ